MSKLSAWFEKEFGAKQENIAPQLEETVASWLKTEALAIDATLTDDIVSEAQKVAPGVPADQIRAIVSATLTKITDAAVAKAGTLLVHDPASP